MWLIIWILVIQLYAAKNKCKYQRIYWYIFHQENGDIIHYLFGFGVHFWRSSYVQQMCVTGSFILILTPASFASLQKKEKYKHIASAWKNLKTKSKFLMVKIFFYNLLTKDYKRTVFSKAQGKSVLHKYDIAYVVEILPLGWHIQWPTHLT